MSSLFDLVPGVYKRYNQEYIQYVTLSQNGTYADCVTIQPDGSESFRFSGHVRCITNGLLVGKVLVTDIRDAPFEKVDKVPL